MNEVEIFCEKLVSEHIEYSDMTSAINKIFAGRPLNDEEKRIIDFLGDQTETTAGQALDVNFIRDNQDEIKEKRA